MEDRKRAAKKDGEKYGGRKSYNDDGGGGRGDDEGGSGGGFSYRRRRARPAADATFDYKDVETLNQYITDEGKIVPGRVSKLNRTQQRQLTNAIKRARHLALIPTSAKHF